MNYLEQIPDTIKVGTAIAAPALTILGVSVEEWTFILSAIVSLLFIIEKLPSLVRKLAQFVQILMGKKDVTRDE